MKTFKEELIELFKRYDAVIECSPALDCNDTLVVDFEVRYRDNEGRKKEMRIDDDYSIFIDSSILSDLEEDLYF